MKLLISGAGIAGPALAYWLKGRGFEITVVERAPALREGGQAVDFRGPVHKEVLERMGLWEPIHQRKTNGSDLVLLDRAGDTFAKLPAVMMSGDVEILRGDLSQLLVNLVGDGATFRFGDHVTALTQDEQGVNVEFHRAKPERFDLVIGADGLHSGVRALTFGAESLFLKHHGYRLATFSLPNVLKLNGTALTYTVPGRSLMVTHERAQLIFTGAPLGDERSDPAKLRQSIRDAYADVGWETPRILAELDRATDLYVDEISTVELDTFFKGRVALLGDAAAGGTLGGQGTPLAIVGAYVLAEELLAARGDHGQAFANYQQLLMPYAKEGQKGAKNVGPFFAPRTSWGLWLRNQFYRAFTSKLLIGQFEKLVKSTASAFQLPRYN